MLIQTLKSFVKAQTSNASTSGIIPKRNRPTFHMLLWLSSGKKKSQLNCHSESFGIYYSWCNHHGIHNSSFFYKKNAKSSVGLSQVRYLQTTHPSILKLALGQGWKKDTISQCPFKHCPFVNNQTQCHYSHSLDIHVSYMNDIMLLSHYMQHLMLL